MTLGTSSQRTHLGQWKAAPKLKIYRKSWLAKLERTTADPRMTPERTDKLALESEGIAVGASSVSVGVALVSVAVGSGLELVLELDPVLVGEVIAVVLVGREMVKPLSRQVEE